MTLEGATDSIKRALGETYSVTPRRHGAKETIQVRHALAIANVRVDHQANSTTFRVHGGGVIVNRVVNEFGLARRVAGAIRGSAPQ